MSEWEDGLADFLEPASVPPPASSPAQALEDDSPRADVAPHFAESAQVGLDVGEETARFRGLRSARWPRLVGYSLLAGAVFGATAWGAVLLIGAVMSDDASPEVEAPSSPPSAIPSTTVTGAAPSAEAPSDESPGSAPVAEPTEERAAAEPPETAAASAEPRSVARTGSYALRGDAALLRLEEAPPWVENMSPRRRLERSDAAIAFGNRLERRGDYESAETWFRRAYALRPNPSAAAVRLALFHEARERYDEAMAWSRHAVDAAPALAAPLYALGRMLERRGRRSEAIDAYRQALERNPHEARVLRRLERLGY